MIVAGLGILVGIMAPVTILLSRHHPLAGMPGAPREMTEMIEFQQKMMSGPAPKISTVVGLVAIAVGAWAIHSALGVYRTKAGVLPSFRRAVAALGVVELASVVVGVWMQIVNIEMLGEFAEKFYSRSHGTPMGVESMKGMMQGSALVGVLFAIGWGILKLAFLAWSYVYAASREVVAHLDR
jgi:hypothetical protein